MNGGLSRQAPENGQGWSHMLLIHPPGPAGKQAIITDPQPLPHPQRPTHQMGDKQAQAHARLVVRGTYHFQILSTAPTASCP